MRMSTGVQRCGDVVRNAGTMRNLYRLFSLSCVRLEGFGVCVFFLDSGLAESKPMISSCMKRNIPELLFDWLGDCNTIALLDSLLLILRCIHFLFAFSLFNG